MAQSINDVLNELKESQKVDDDMREQVRESDLFLNKRDGQWDPYLINMWGSRPRYTFDHANPIVNAIMAPLEKRDFGIKVSPGGGGASKDIATHYKGMIRGIEQTSKASRIYMNAARVMVGTGLSGWRVTHDYICGDSIDQELIIEPVWNFVDRVWFSTDGSSQTMSDSSECWLLTAMTMKEYKDIWPKGSRLSVGQARHASAYDDTRSDTVIVGERYYKQEYDRDLVQMSNGQVFVADEKFEKVRDELYAQGVFIKREVSRKATKIKHQFFDGGDFLEDSDKTPFNMLPIVPCYGNFSISEDGKVVYWGAIEKILDPARINNFAESKKITDVATKAPSKIWMSKRNAVSDDVRRSLETHNTNDEPIQFFDPDEKSLPPNRMREFPPDTALSEISQNSKNFMRESSSIPDPSKGIGTPGQAYATADLLKSAGDDSNLWAIRAVEVSIEHTASILIGAIPKVYDTERSVPSVGDDGSVEEISIKERVLDDETGDVVVLCDLNKGRYSVVCKAGQSYSNRQEETISKMIDVSAVEPSVMQRGSDVFFSNLNMPGSDILAERYRLQLVDSGAIPEKQLTDEEKERLVSQSQGQQEPSPAEKAAMAVSEAELQNSIANMQDTLSKIAERETKAVLEAQKLKLQQEKQSADVNKQFMDSLESITNQLNTQADTLKKLSEASVSPETIYQQEELIEETQEAQPINRNVADITV